MSALDSTLSGGGKNVTVIGAGNIGSQLLALVARMPAVGCVTIVDPDSFELKNVRTQAVVPADAGKSKALVQAARLRKINPALRVKPIVARVEDVPPGALRADAMALCLDSRASRRAAGGIAWRLGMPFVDAGVHSDGLLARVHAYRPGCESACYECALDESAYAAELENFACDGSRIEAAPTNAPASLGALAASLQAIEIEKILAGDWARVAVDREVVIEAGFHHHYVTKFARNPACKFDHRTFTVRDFRGENGVLSLGDLFARGTDAVRVEGQQFAKQWACGACLTSAEVFGLQRRLAVVCPQCGRAMRAVGFHLADRLSAADVPEGKLAAPLANLGFRSGDIFTAFVGDEETHYELNALTSEEP